MRYSPKMRGFDPPSTTSLLEEGALAEISFHLALLTPLPSKPMRLHTLRVSAETCLRLKLVDLTQVGVDEASYGTLNYETCQAIGDAVAFLEHDGLIVPSARWQCDNLVLFTDNHGFSSELEAIAERDVDWQAWARDKGLLEADD
jgi:hypothetical protein